LGDEHGDIVGEVLRILFRLLNLIEYDYSVIDSTKLSDWLGRLHELFLDVRVRSGSTIFPVHAELTSSEVEFVRGISEGIGFMLGDGAFDAKPVLNTIASRIPIIRRGLTSPGGYGAGMRDKMYDESLYSYRLGRGIRGINSIGDKLGTRRRESAETRIILES
jgi:hypothetical protein